MLLTALWAVPALGCGVAVLSPQTVARRFALALSFGIFLYSVWLLLPFQASSGEALRLLEVLGPRAYGIQYKMGIDGVALSLCWLTSFLTFIALFVSRDDLPPAFWASFLMLESALFGVFTAQSLFYFYIFWDVSLIPMFFIIGLWGSDRRRHASMKFILYTFLGSMALLVGMAALVAAHHSATGVWTWDMADLQNSTLAPGISMGIFVAMAVGFAVKIPLVPLHNWLPEVHTEAPMAGSALLAGSMLKMGVYGFLHILLPVFPVLSKAAFPVFGALGVINILYGALCAMAQTDLKRLVAYTSVSHLGFCMLGLFSLTSQGVTGGSLQMINHGLSTGGLFLLIGMLYERTHRRGVADFGGLARTAPGFAFFFGLILLSSIGMPGLNGFVGEFLSLLGAARVSPVLAALGLLGTVLAAAYGLPTFQRVFWDPAGPDSVSSQVGDLEPKERAVLWSLLALILWLGIYPKPLMELMTPALSAAVLR